MSAETMNYLETSGRGPGVLANITRTLLPMLTSYRYVSTLRRKYGCDMASVFQGFHPVTGDTITLFVNADGSGLVVMDPNWERTDKDVFKFMGFTINYKSGSFDPSESAIRFKADWTLVFEEGYRKPTIWGGDRPCRYDLIANDEVDLRHGFGQITRERIELYAVFIDGMESIAVTCIDRAKIHAAHLKREDPHAEVSIRRIVWR
jgi:hypothetical protein